MNYSLIIIDGLNMAHRFHWVHQNFKANGKKTGMFHGFLNKMISLRRDHRKSKIIVCWDSKRLKKAEAYEDYKSDRNPKEDSFYEAVDTLKKMLSYYGIQQRYALGYEADDVAARICKENREKEKLLITKDSDWLLMMDNKTTINVNDKFYSFKEFLDHLGFSNKKEFILFHSITGSHNNIKGIPYIDKKKTKNLIILCDHDLKKLFKIPPLEKPLESVRKKILDHKTIIEQNYSLIPHITSGYKLERIKTCKDLEILIKGLKKYELRMVVSRLKKELEDTEETA